MDLFFIVHTAVLGHDFQAAILQGNADRRVSLPMGLSKGDGDFESVAHDVAGAGRLGAFVEGIDNRLDARLIAEPGNPPAFLVERAITDPRLGEAIHVFDELVQPRGFVSVGALPEPEGEVVAVRRRRGYR